MHLPKIETRALTTHRTTAFDDKGKLGRVTVRAGELVIMEGSAAAKARVNGLMAFEGSSVISGADAAKAEEERKAKSKGREIVEVKDVEVSANFKPTKKAKTK